SLREDDMAARLEGCTVELELNNIRDMNGNYAEPVKWQAYVRRNQLVWKDSKASVYTIPETDAELLCTIENRGGSYEKWEITQCPSWLIPTRSSGTLEPLGNQEISFTVPASTPVGHYEGTVVLTGSRGIGEPLFVTLTASGLAPTWHVDPSQYESSMNVVGQLRIDDVISTDDLDMVAAFVGDECRGVASPRYFSRDGSYYINLTVYGNPQKDGAAPERISYRVYDASTGLSHPSVSLLPDDKALTFRPDSIVGSMSQPVVFCPDSVITQLVFLEKGWNWVSFNVVPDTDDLPAFLRLYLDGITLIKDEKANYKPATGIGDLTRVEPSTMYKVLSNGIVQCHFYGKAARPDEVEMAVPGRAWTWMGYPCSAPSGLDAALANLNPEEGDIIKSQSAFSTYTGGTWFGTLEALQPGQGYLYYSQAAAGKTFHLATPASRAQAPSTRNEAGLYAPFENTMNIMAQATSNGQPA
ncbi:MAG: hypothetical protein KBS75_08170, partial [Bacteroidales bacterium]|nr:hypothetical protein [Candidatus Equimonas faecalis]